jgi:hypothetical protein
MHSEPCKKRTFGFSSSLPYALNIRALKLIVIGSGDSVLAIGVISTEDKAMNIKVNSSIKTED